MLLADVEDYVDQSVFAKLSAGKEVDIDCELHPSRVLGVDKKTKCYYNNRGRCGCTYGVFCKETLRH